ncbi:MAG TPA: tetratricopeptide repeat protein, partial [Bacteroidota bacterium]|nr:tetratricopeptide repeat protein [Bacteroidota bacterium]
FLPLIMEKVPLFCMAAVSSIITFIVQQHAGAVPSLEHLPLPTRIENAVLSYFQYVEKTLWPSGLSIFYPYYARLTSMPVVVLALVALVAITYWVIRAARARPPLLVGWLWFAGTLVPVIGIVQVGSSAMDDRYMYIPMVGLLIMIAWGIPPLLGSWKNGKLALATGSGIVLILLTVTTSLQVECWHDTISLFDHAQRVTTDNSIAQANLAIALTKQGRLEEGLEHYRESLRINPGSAEMQSNLGSTLIRMGRIQEATYYCQEAVRLKPEQPEAQYNLALCLAQRGDIPDAIDHYAEAVRLKPDYADARLNLANLLARYAAPTEAEKQFKDLIHIDPRYEKGYLAFGYFLASTGRIDEAIDCYTKALEVKPDFAEAHYCLGLALEKKDDIAGAARHFSEAVRIKPGYAAARAALEWTVHQQDTPADSRKHP